MSKLPEVRQSTISKFVFPFISTKKYTPEEIIINKEASFKRMQRGHEEHEKVQAWLDSCLENGIAEKKYFFKSTDLTVVGHIDYDLPEFAIEFKFINNNRFMLYDSYLFQLAFYLVVCNKPVLYVMTDLVSKEMYLIQFALDNDDKNTIMETLGRIFELYILKLIINHKKEDGRYDVDIELEDLQKLISNEVELIKAIVWKGAGTPTNDQIALMYTYSVMNAWTLKFLGM